MWVFPMIPVLWLRRLSLFRHRSILAQRFESLPILLLFSLKSSTSRPELTFLAMRFEFLQCTQHRCTEVRVPPHVPSVVAQGSSPLHDTRIVTQMLDSLPMIPSSWHRGSSPFCTPQHLYYIRVPAPPITLTYWCRGSSASHVPSILIQDSSASHDHGILIRRFQCLL